MDKILYYNDPFLGEIKLERKGYWDSPRGGEAIYIHDNPRDKTYYLRSWHYETGEITYNPIKTISSETIDKINEVAEKLKNRHTKIQG